MGFVLIWSIWILTRFDTEDEDICRKVQIDRFCSKTQKTFYSIITYSSQFLI